HLRSNDSLSTQIENFSNTTTLLNEIWAHQHNSVAKQLKENNPAWDDEQLYQEARRIVIAQIQHITIHEYLPLLIGKKTMIFYNISNTPDEFTNYYNPLVRPDTINVFAAVIGEFYRTMWATATISNSPLERSDYVQSLFVEPASHPSLKDLRKDAFQSGPSVDIDPAALLIQRGRDHGIPSYVKWRKFCRGEQLFFPISSFDQLNDIVIDPHNLIPALKKVYRSVEDVDLIVLALAEKLLHGSLVGPTLGCILALQYQKVIHGDSYWYSNNMADFSFTLPQLRAITSTTFAKVICRYLGAGAHVQPNAFLVPDNFDNYPVNCNSSTHNDMSLDEWKSLPIEFPITDRNIRILLEKAKENVEKKKKAKTRFPRS
ncbi:hypothetical protein GCK32_013820, partial [Trichostrongylus colubriformis]